VTALLLLTHVGATAKGDGRDACRINLIENVAQFWIQGMEGASDTDRIRLVPKGQGWTTLAAVRRRDDLDVAADQKGLL
jgi:hypothetical protein